MQKFCLDTLGELGGRLVAGYLGDGIAVVLERDLTQPQREVIRQTAEDLAVFFQTRLDARELTVADFTQALGELADLLAVLLPAETAEWRRALTLAWVALASAETVRAGLSSLSGSWSVSAVGGFEIGDSHDELALPEPPHLVGAELETFFGTLPPQLKFSHAMDYLLGQGLGPMLGAALPELVFFFDSLARHTGLTPGDLIASGLQAAITTDLSQTEVYQALRDFVREHVDGALTQELLPALRAEAGRANNAVLLKWLDEAAEPGLLLLSGFAFDRLDAAVAGTLTGDLSPFTNTFRTALSILVGRLVNLNVIVIADITLNFVVDTLHRGLRELEATIRTDATHAVALAAPQFFGALLPAGPLLPQAVGEASQELAADLMGAAADGFGPAVWTAGRKAELLDTFQALLESVDGDPDFAYRPALERFLAEVAECNYLPNGDRLVRLLVLQAEVLAAAVQATLPQTLEALRLFALRVTLGIRRGMG